MSNPKMILVEIMAEERVQYHQMVRMSQEEFNKVNTMLDVDHPDANDIVMGFLDRYDVCSADDVEIQEFRIAPKVKA